VLPAADPALLDVMLVAITAALRDATGLSGVVDHDTAGPLDAADRIQVLVLLTGELVGISWVFPPLVTHAFAHTAIEGLGAIDATLERDAAIELANVLAGHATGAISDRGVQVAIVRPPRLATTIGPGVRARVATAGGPIDIVVHAGGAA
jgi:hypothetical protein